MVFLFFLIATCTVPPLFFDSMLLFIHLFMSYSGTPWTAIPQASLSFPSSPGVCSNSCPLSWWCHPAISSSVTPFFSCPQYFPSSGSFPMSWLFASGGQSIGASASVLPKNIQGWFPSGLTGLIPLLSKGTLKSLLQHHNLKVSVLQCSAFFMVQLSHLYMTIEKTITLTIRTFFNSKFIDKLNANINTSILML